jgi:hypothetical protein
MGVRSFVVHVVLASRAAPGRIKEPLLPSFSSSSSAASAASALTFPHHPYLTLLLSSYFILSPFAHWYCDGCAGLYPTAMTLGLVMFLLALKVLCILYCRRALLLPWALHDLEELDDGEELDGADDGGDVDDETGMPLDLESNSAMTSSPGTVPSSRPSRLMVSSTLSSSTDSTVSSSAALAVKPILWFAMRKQFGVHVSRIRVLGLCGLAVIVCHLVYLGLLATEKPKLITIQIIVQAILASSFILVCAVCVMCVRVVKARMSAALAAWVFDP